MPGTTADPACPQADQATAPPRWRGWAEGLAEARARGRPVLASLDPGWTTAGQRLDLAAAEDPRLGRALRELAVPVRVEPFDRPDIAARLRRAVQRLSGCAGPPCLALLDRDGRVIAPFTASRHEGVPGLHPSLAALIEAAGGLAAPGSPAGEAQPAGTTAPEDGPRLLRPRALRRLVAAASRDAAARARLRAELDAMLAGGVRDHLGEGFHRGSRDGLWLVPWFEKILPDNAAFGVVLLRAARLLEDPALAAVAERTLGFVVRQVAADPLAAAIAADSAFHTWTPAQFAAALPPALLKTAALRFHMTRAAVPHVLYAARTPEAIAGFGHEGAAQVAAELAQAVAALAAARARRPAPAVIRSAATGPRCATIAALAEAASLGAACVDLPALAAAFRALAWRRFDPRRGWRHADGDASCFAAEQRLATEAAAWLQRATGRADVAEHAAPASSR